MASIIKPKQCKVCKDILPAHWDGESYFGDAKTKIITDSEGRQWSGKTCAACNVKRTRDNMKRLRESRKVSDEC